MAHCDRQTQERSALHNRLLRLFGVLGDVSQPGAVQRFGRCGAKCRDARRYLAARSTHVDVRADLIHRSLLSRAETPLFRRLVD